MMDDKPAGVKISGEAACTLEIAELARRLGADPVHGLCSVEAARRLATDGRNELRAVPPIPAWRRLLAQFHGPLVYLLLAAIAIAFGAWMIEGRSGWPIDAIVIALIVAGNAIIGYLQEVKAETAVAALARMTAVTSAVVRDGAVLRIPSAELVSGDLLVLAEGDAVGADARIVESAALRLQEASLTGESEPVLKERAQLAAAPPLGDRTNMVFKVPRSCRAAAARS